MCLNEAISPRDQRAECGEGTASRTSCAFLWLQSTGSPPASIQQAKQEAVGYQVGSDTVEPDLSVS